jgi:hypothetical protein
VYAQVEALTQIGLPVFEPGGAVTVDVPGAETVEEAEVEPSAE